MKNIKTTPLIELIRELSTATNNKRIDDIKIELVDRWPNLIEEQMFIPSTYTEEDIEDKKNEYKILIKNRRR